MHGRVAGWHAGGMTEQQHVHDLVAERLVDAVLEEGAALLRWLDVGVGDGAVVDAALKSGVERVDGVVLDPDVIEAANDRFDRAIVGLRIGTATDLAGFVGPYDVVVSSLTLDVRDNPVGALEAMRERLTYGSRAWVAVRERTDATGAGPGTATREELTAAAEQAGWTGEVTELDLDGDAPDVLVVSTEA